VTEAHDYDLIGELVDAPELGYSRPAQAANPFPILNMSSVPSHAMPHL
jgi:hypothetical protein